jgi:CheY-like chemotaxis protein
MCDHGEYSDMTSSRSRDAQTVTGGAHLARRSTLLKRIQALHTRVDLLIVEDKVQDAHFIAKPLERLFGEHARLTIAATVEEMKSALKKGKFSAIVLDDRLDKGATADATLPLIRATGHRGPVIVVSAILTQSRRAELKRLGAEGILTKDEVDSVALGENLLAALGLGEG